MREHPLPSEEDIYKLEYRLICAIEGVEEKAAALEEAIKRAESTFVKMAAAAKEIEALLLQHKREKSRVYFEVSEYAEIDRRLKKIEAALLALKSNNH